MSVIAACISTFKQEMSIAKALPKASGHVDRVIVCDDGSTDMAADYERKAFLLSHA